MPDKSETARINGAKSKDPVTPKGLTRSSQNALKHGRSLPAEPMRRPGARQIVLPDENRGAWRELLNAYIGQFQPATPVEHALVETMAAAQWCLRRLLAMETSILDMDMFDRKDEEFVPPDDQPRPSRAQFPMPSQQPASAPSRHPLREHAATGP